MDRRIDFLGEDRYCRVQIVKSDDLIPEEGRAEDESFLVFNCLRDQANALRVVFLGIQVASRRNSDVNRSIEARECEAEVRQFVSHIITGLSDVTVDELGER